MFNHRHAQCQKIDPNQFSLTIFFTRNALKSRQFCCFHLPKLIETFLGGSNGINSMKRYCRRNIFKWKRWSHEPRTKWQPQFIPNVHQNFRQLLFRDISLYMPHSVCLYNEQMQFNCFKFKYIIFTRYIIQAHHSDHLGHPNHRCSFDNVFL